MGEYIRPLRMRYIEHHCSGICASSLGVHCLVFQDSVVASSSSISGPLTCEVEVIALSWNTRQWTLSVGGQCSRRRVFRFITSETWELRGKIFPLNVSVLEGSLVLELNDLHLWREHITLQCEHHITLGCSVILGEQNLQLHHCRNLKTYFFEIWYHLSQFLRRSEFLTFGISGLNLYVIFDVMASV